MGREASEATPETKTASGIKLFRDVRSRALLDSSAGLRVGTWVALYPAPVVACELGVLERAIRVPCAPVPARTSGEERWFSRVTEDESCPRASWTSQKA